MSDTIHTIFLLVVLILAVVAGLYFGRAVADSGRTADGRPRRGIGPALRDATSSAAIKLWRWRQSRKREADRRERSGS